MKLSGVCLYVGFFISVRISLKASGINTTKKSWKECKKKISGLAEMKGAHLNLKKIANFTTTMIARWKLSVSVGRIL